MRIAISFLALCSLLLIGSSIAQQSQTVTSAPPQADPILMTAKYVALLQDYKDTMEWHNHFARQFAESSRYRSEEVDLVADVFRTKGGILKIGVNDAGDNRGKICVEVSFKRSRLPKVSRTPGFPTSSVVFTLDADRTFRIASIALNEC